MASLFGDDGVDDLFNDNLHEDPNQLPSDDEGEKLFAEDEENAGEPGNQDAQKVEPKKRAVRNPRPRLTVETLRGPRGIQTIENYFKDIKFKGKGYEKTDLDEVLRRLQHWGHRMYPTYTFDDVLNNIERLGKKKPLQVHMTRYRLGQLEELSAYEAEALDEAQDEHQGGAGDEPFDEFDALLGEQIAISRLAPRTPHQRKMSTASSNSTMTTPSFSRGNAVMSTPYTAVNATTFDRNGAPAAPTFDRNGAPLASLDTSDYGKPLPHSQPPTPAAKKLSNEQMARIAENRRLAQERLKAKQQQETLS
ncbi:protein TIPIN homolog [Drosophila eugracilis]|uniref:protein TIPIN homolog n=1 Tax=Drosophila eugracilis TaxID=29029 RepID=UPI001BDA2517|nr:protein TIPIN homolog [Drosophila eugracilis]